MQRIYKEYTKSIQTIYKQYTKNKQRIYKEYTKNVQRIYKEYANNIAIDSSVYPNFCKRHATNPAIASGKLGIA